MTGVYNSDMKNRIELMGSQLEYELQRKKVKNINLEESLPRVHVQLIVNHLKENG